jgi:hypothetical protein
VGVLVAAVVEDGGGVVAEVVEVAVAAGLAQLVRRKALMTVSPIPVCKILEIFICPPFNLRFTYYT